MNWDAIQYIFQIPLSWYKKVHNRVFKSYGENFIKVDEGDYGGTRIGIDYDSFHDAVQSIAGETQSGTVSKVDGVSPDSTGNVNFGLQPDKWMKTDGNGHIAATDEQPVSVDPLQQGVMYNEYGGLTYKAVGTSSGSVAAGDHEHGNITSAGKMKDCAATSCLIVTDTTGKITHSDGSMSETSYAGSDLATLTALVNAFEWDHSTGTPKIGKAINSVDGVSPAANGNVPLNAVRSVNSKFPDVNGAVDLGRLVKTVNGNEPDDAGNIDVAGTVKSVNETEPDENGNVDLGSIVNSVNDVQPDEAGNVQLDIPELPEFGTGHDDMARGDHTHTYEDIDDWSAATMSFLETSDVCTAGTTAGLDYAGDNFVCNTNHGHKASDITDADESFVTIDTDQTVEGRKTFAKPISIRGEEGVRGIINASQIAVPGVYLGDAFGLYSEDYGSYVRSSKVVCLDAPAGFAVLANKPTDSAQDEAIATIGNVRDAVQVKVDNIQAEDGNINLGAVRTTTNQVVDGQKTFKRFWVAGQTPSTSSQFTNLDENDMTFFNTAAQATTGGHGLKWCKALNVVIEQDGGYTLVADNTAAISYNPPIIGSTLEDTVPATLLIASHLQYSRVQLQAPYIMLRGSEQNSVLVGKQPTETNADSLVVATCGYVQTHAGKIKTINGEGPDADGNINIKAGGTVKKVDNVSPDESGNVSLGAVTTTDVCTAGTTAGLDYAGQQYACNTNHGHKASDITDADESFVTIETDQTVTGRKTFENSIDAPGIVNNGGAVKITAAVNQATLENSPSVDASNTSSKAIATCGWTADNFIKSTSLTPSKFVKTDSDGNLTTAQAKVITVGEETQPQSTTINSVVTGVTWNGTQLVVASSKLQFENGVLVKITANSNKTIETAVFTAS